MKTKHNLIFSLFLILLLDAVCFSQTNDEIEYSEYPKIIYRPELIYPPLAVDAGIEATIYLKVKIGKDGSPKNCSVAKRIPEYAFVFDEPVMKSAMQFKFSPAIEKMTDEPVDFEVLIPFRFNIEGFEPPTCVKLARPHYPEEAIAMGYEGWVAIAVLVDENGMTIKNKPVIVARSNSHIKVFDDAALEAARTSEYKPATQDGSYTKGWTFVKIDFVLPNK